MAITYVDDIYYHLSELHPAEEWPVSINVFTYCILGQQNLSTLYMFSMIKMYSFLYSSDLFSLVCQGVVIEEIMQDMGSNYRNNDMSTKNHGLCRTINHLALLFAEEC